MNTKTQKVKLLICVTNMENNLDELYISYKVEVVVIVLLNEQEQVKYQQQTL